MAPLATPPPGLSRKEEHTVQIRETLKAQIGMGENLGPVVTVMDRARASIYTGMFYLGAVDSGLVVVELFMSGKPESVQRIERGRITRLELKKGLLTGRVRIHLSGQKRPTTFYTQRPFRGQMQALASAVEVWQGRPQ